MQVYFSRGWKSLPDRSGQVIRWGNAQKYWQVASWLPATAAVKSLSREAGKPNGKLAPPNSTGGCETG